MVKLSNTEMKTLLSIYEKYPVLYNHLSRQYKDVVLQQHEFEKLQAEVNESGLEIPDLKAQIKNIRDTYRKERTKVITKKGTGTDVEEVVEYTPKLAWYNQANAFLQPFVEVRERTENLRNVNTAPPKKKKATNDASDLINTLSDAQASSTETHSESFDSENASVSGRPSKRSKAEVVKSPSTLETMLNHVSEMREEARSVLNKSDKDVCGYFGELVTAELRTFPPLRQLRARQQIQGILLQHAEEMAAEAVPHSTTPSSAESAVMYTLVTDENGEIKLQALPTNANNASDENNASVPN